MEPVYVFGHKHPDTDTVCAAISYSYLKNELGMYTVPRVLGHLNNETKFVLKKFSIKEPEYLSDVKIQIKDISYKHNVMLKDNATLEATANYMSDKDVSGIALVDNKKQVTHYIDLDMLVKELVSDKYYLDTSFDNVMDALSADIIIKANDEIKGPLIKPGRKTKYKKNDILIIDNLEDIEIGKISNSGIQMIILLDNIELSVNEIEIFKNKKISVVSTNLPIYEVVRKLKLSNYVKSIAIDDNLVTVDRLEYVNDFIKKQQRLGHTNYPVVNNKNECVGLLNSRDLKEFESKKVILVDHNELVQSVEGIEEAEILEVIDHHNIGSIGSNSPIALRMMPVGSTCTIIYTLFKENNVKIPKNIAGLMLSAIISDTLALESPTTTKMDVEIANNLAKICKIDIKKFSIEMFKAGSSLKGKSAEDVILADYKEFTKNNEKIFISHVVSLDFAEVNFFIDDYVDVLDNLINKNYKLAVLMVTDVSRNGSYVLFSESAKEILSNIFDTEMEQGIFIQGLVSRKKQLMPNILELI